MTQCVKDDYEGEFQVLMMDWLKHINIMINQAWLRPPSHTSVHIPLAVFNKTREHKRMNDVIILKTCDQGTLLSVRIYL